MIVKNVSTERSGFVETPGEIDNHIYVIKRTLEAGANICWRDGKGVVHALRGQVRHNVSTASSVVWAPACGYPYASTQRAPAGVAVSCLKCIAAPPITYACRTCGEYPCLGITGHVYEPDYRYPVEPR